MNNIQVSINAESKEIPENLNIPQLLNFLKLKDDLLVVELNEEVVQAHLNPPTPELSGFFDSTDSWNVLDSHDRLWS